MKIQYKLLTEKFDDPDTTVSTADLIKSMANGNGAHHAGALKLGLREGLSFIHPKLPETIQPSPSSTQQRRARKAVLVSAMH